MVEPMDIEALQPIYRQLDVGRQQEHGKNF
ncbi:hypothetical protein IMAU10062_02771 [Lactiplantibacillus plantarum]|nr:hypothetical protein [Lactiplantibacillus plantarum]